MNGQKNATQNYIQSQVANYSRQNTLHPEIPKVDKSQERNYLNPVQNGKAVSTDDKSVKEKLVEICRQTAGNSL